MSPRRKHFALCVLAGLSFTSAQAPLGIWPGVVLGFALSVWLLHISETPLRAFWTGWSIGASYFATSLIWIVEPFLVDFAATAWMAPFALVLMASGLALFWAMPFWGAAKLGKPVTILALWPLAEYARSVLFSGFPWGLSAYAWVDTPIAQTAAWVGPHVLASLTLAVSASPIFTGLRPGAPVARPGLPTSARLALVPLGCLAHQRH